MLRHIAWRRPNRVVKRVDLAAGRDVLEDGFLKAEIVIGSYTVNEAPALGGGCRDTVWITHPLSAISPQFKSSLVEPGKIWFPVVLVHNRASIRGYTRYAPSAEASPPLEWRRKIHCSHAELNENRHHLLGMREQSGENIR